MFIQRHFKNKLRGKLSNLKAHIGDFRPRNHSVILLYHGIDIHNNTNLNTKFISNKKFEAELRLFKKHYEIVNLANLEAQTDRPKLIITFDDGYENNYLLARPILEKLQIPATFFISRPQCFEKDILWADLIDLCAVNGPDKIVIRETLWTKGRNGYVSNQGENLKAYCKRTNHSTILEVYRSLEPYASFKSEHRNNLYWKLMNNQQIHDLAQHELFSIGAHGTLHTSLNQISGHEVLKELYDAKRDLENITQKPVEDFAFPHGESDDKSVLMARTAGFKRQFLMDGSEFKRENDVYNRFGINPFISAKAQLYHTLRGKY